ncbi:hypothetical protein BFP78_10330 [Gaetbulibacter sp. 5U11]|nr:hypothetical protein BFP78_10330 [Gaetbulibacter sp. 5U11]
MTAVDSLVKKHFKVSSFNEALKKIEKKEDTYFPDTLFVSKASFIEKLKQLAKEINELSDAYKTAQDASKSGSIIQGFASAGLGAIQKEYIQKRKAMVHHVSLFVKKNSNE